MGSYFEQVIASAAVGVAKPEAGIFRQALQAFGVNAAQSLHVGDSLGDDYYGARKAGLQAVLLDRHRKTYNGVVCIQTLHDVPVYLS